MLVGALVCALAAAVAVAVGGGESGGPVGAGSPAARVNDERPVPQDAAVERVGQDRAPVEEAGPAVPPPGRMPARDPCLLTGRVVTAAGAAVEGAAVEVSRVAASLWLAFDPTHEPVAAVLGAGQTGADGGFALPVPRAEELSLRVRATGYAPVVVPACRGGSELTVVVEKGATFTGFVTRAGDGSPVPSVRLRGEWWSGNGMRELFDGETDARGVFRFEDVAPGPCRLTVCAPRHANPSPREMELRAGETLRHDIALEAGRVLCGTVTDAVTRKPIGGATVGCGPRFFDEKTSRTDTNGRYALHGLDRGHPVGVRAPGYATRRAFVLVPDAETEHDVALQPGGAARGRILGPDRAPLAHVYVAALASTGTASPIDDEVDGRAAHTGGDGTFVLDGLRTDLHHALQVRHRGCATVVYDFPRRVHAGTTLDLGDIALAPQATLEGRVVDGEGEPIAGARVTLDGVNGDRVRLLAATPDTAAGGELVMRRHVRADDAGLFGFSGVAPGRYGVIAEAHAVKGKADVAVTAPGESVHGIEVVLELGLSITGQVVTPDGEPPATALVMLRPEPWQRQGEERRSLAGACRFSFRGLTSGAVTLVAIAPGTRADPSPWEVGVVAGVRAGTDDVRVVLSRAATIEGVVRDENGAPCAGARVTAQQSGRSGAIWRRSAQTGEDGVFVIRVGEGATYEVYVDREAYRGAAVAESTAVRHAVSAGTNGLELVLR